MKNAECVEINEKSTFRFLVFDVYGRFCFRNWSMHFEYKFRTSRSPGTSVPILIGGPLKSFFLGYFPTKDMQTPTLSFFPGLMKDAQCDESNEQSIFRFLFFELS